MLLMKPHPWALLIGPYLVYRYLLIGVPIHVRRPYMAHERSLAKGPAAAVNGADRALAPLAILVIHRTRCAGMLVLAVVIVCGRFGSRQGSVAKLGEEHRHLRGAGSAIWCRA